MVLNSRLLSGMELMLVQGVLKHSVTFFLFEKRIGLFLSVLQNISNVCSLLMDLIYYEEVKMKTYSFLFFLIQPRSLCAKL